MPPHLCPKEQSDCELARTLTPLYTLLRGGHNASVILQMVLATLGEAVTRAPGGVPRQRHRWVTALLGATEGLLQGGAALLRPGTTLSTSSSGLQLALARVPPPGPLSLQVPNVQLDVAGTGDTGLAMVALLSQEKLPPLLEGAPPVRWGGWGDLPPPPPPQRLSDRYSYRLLSPVATVVVAPSEAPPEITLRFQHTPLDRQLGAQVLCAFWDPKEQLWATEGCWQVPPQPVTPPDPHSTTCTCSHLTSFAVLMAFRELEDSWALDVLTQVGLGVSVVALGVAAATFLLCRALKGLRTTLHLHLSLSLLLAHGTFLLGIERTQSPVGCAVVAGILHFSFLAAFCWMGLEGLHLYVLLVRVFVPSWLRVRHVLLAGYGPPALLVAITAAAFPSGYGTSEYCWLSLERGFRWSFQGPVCLIIAFNAVILVVTVWKLVQKFSEVAPDMGHLRRMRVLVATGAGQLCLLGTGWALGLGLGLGGVLGGIGDPPVGALSPFPLLFCALNAAQGLFILLCHCLARRQVRDAYRACLCPGTKPYSEFTSNTSNTRVSRQQPYA